VNDLAVEHALLLRENAALKQQLDLCVALAKKSEDTVVIESSVSVDAKGYAVLDEHFVGVLDKIVGKRCRFSIEVLE
jgi:hypothetical protein